MLYPSCVMVRNQAVQGKRPRTRQWAVIIGVLVVFLGIVLVAELTSDNTPAAPPSSGSSASETNTDKATDALGLARRTEGDPMAIGDVDAPVALVEWTDMRCPFCATFGRETLPVLMTEYVKTGKVRIEVHDMALFGEQSETAAVAARAAAKQNKYFEYLSAVYRAAPERGHPDLPQATLIAFAQQAGVPDIARFTDDLDDPALRTAVQQSTISSQRLGVTSVPFFVAGDTPFSGAQPIDVFRKVLDAAIAAAR